MTNKGIGLNDDELEKVVGGAGHQPGPGAGGSGVKDGGGASGGIKNGTDDASNGIKSGVDQITSLKPPNP